MAENAIAVQEKPILFTGAMVRAVIEDRKTNTRRVCLLPSGAMVPSEWHFCGLNGLSNAVFTVDEITYTEVKNRYGDKGARIWVRETYYRWGHWEKSGKTDKGAQRWKFIAIDNRVVFAATDTSKESPTHRGDDGWWKRPAIFLPRWASRLTLEIVSVKVERVQEISEADAIAEGVERNCPNGNDPEKIKQCPACAPSGVCQSRDEFIHAGLGECDFPVTAKEAFRYLWDSINEKRGFGWEKNPWVWAIEFKAVK